MNHECLMIMVARLMQGLVAAAVAVLDARV